MKHLLNLLCALSHKHLKPIIDSKPCINKKVFCVWYLVEERKPALPLSNEFFGTVDADFLNVLEACYCVLLGL